jgi:hypothetical protein
MQTSVQREKRDVQQERRKVKLRTSIVLLSLAASLPPLLLIDRTAAQDPAGPRATAHSGNVPVVVELFTSEGCSSCPPADQLLAKLEAEQPVRNVEIIALEQHVDYWNNGGWMDPFSSSSYTARQYEYAAKLGNGNAYTPQMVVDGQAEFVGGRTGQARSVIEQVASKQKTEVVVAAAGRDKAEKFHVTVGAVANLSSGDTAEVWMAITETGLHSNVRGGENSGEDLHHAAVVRKLWKIGTAKDPGMTSFSGEEPVKLDRGWKRGNIRVVVFAQEKKSRRILGAGSVKLQPQS